MKDLFKLLSILVVGLIGGAIPFAFFYLLWSWCLAQVPASLAYAGLIKVGITLGMVLLGGGSTVALAILGGFLGAALVAALIDL